MPQLPTVDTKNKPATAEQIQARWLELEAAPVEALGFVVDFDERSEKRMADTVDNWSSLPLIPGILEEDGWGGAKTVKWRMADNSVVTFTHIELQEFLAAARSARAARAAILFAQVQAFKADPQTTYRDLANWGL